MDAHDAFTGFFVADAEHAFRTMREKLDEDAPPLSKVVMPPAPHESKLRGTATTKPKWMR